MCQKNLKNVFLLHILRLKTGVEFMPKTTARKHSQYGYKIS